MSTVDTAPADAGTAAPSDSAIPEGDQIPDGTPAAEDTTTPEADDGTGTSLLESFAKGGVDFRRKYQSDADFLRGVREMQATISRRDEDAQLGKLLRGHEQEIADFFRQRNAPPPPADKSDGLPPRQEYQMLIARVIDPSTNQARADAKREDIARLRTIQDQLEGQIYDLVQNPKAFLDSLTKEQATAIRNEIQNDLSARMAHASIQAEVNAFEDENREWLFANGADESQGWSPQGQRLLAYAREHIASEEAIGNRVNDRRALDVALWRLRAEQADSASPTRAKTPAPRGVRRPSTTGTTETVQARIEKMIAKGASMAEVQAELDKAAAP